MLKYMLKFMLVPGICLLLINSVSPFSLTANGEWKNSIAESSLDCQRFMCTANNNSWRGSYSQNILYDQQSGCDALINAGVTTIFFHGDSYMRQMYAAMLITLNGDYRYGSIKNATLSPQCEYQRQFFEKKCGTRDLNHYGVVCGGKIILDPVLTGFSNVDHCSRSNGTVVLWSFGNYKVVRYGRAGVNNATMYQQYFERDICPTLRSRRKDVLIDATTEEGAIADRPCSVWWVSTHYRMRAYFEDEKPDLVKGYNLGMRSFFESGGCGAVNYIDVYNMTSALALQLPIEAEKLTYDGVHWGMEINLIKAQIIIHALSQSHKKKVKI